MLFLYILIVWQIQAVPEQQFNMYTRDNHQDKYCLLGHNTNNNDRLFHEETVISIYEVIWYCLRPSKEDNFIKNLNFQNANDPHFTFPQLKEKNITSQKLLSWSAPIELAEQYQIFLNNDSNALLEDDIIFYNCTSPWFGPTCRFTFDYPMNQSFNDIIDLTFDEQRRANKEAKVTCYQHLQCETLLFCLTWQEICNGKKDCLDGSDENNCWQLEVNQCTKDEYRCHNGQCIPIEFLYDTPYYSDCLDRTDELYQGDMAECNKAPNFRCEEHTCFPGGSDFSCGNSECTNGIIKCYNGRDNLLPSDSCSNATACSMNMDYYDNIKWCQRFCSNTSCIKQYCQTPYEFRAIPRLLGHIRFLYTIKDIEPNQFTTPDYICYDEKLCGEFLSPTIYIGNLTCRHFNDVGLENIDSYGNVETLVEYVKDRFRACLIITNQTDYCNYPTMYQCKNSSKCISKQRLVDGFFDCPFNDDETYNQSCSLTDIHQRFKCSSNNTEKCFALLAVHNTVHDCQFGEDESTTREKKIASYISFPIICDGKIELLPILINGKNETDETECDYWPCNNTYSRCDRFWLCDDGADEVNCRGSICPTQYHDCILINDTSKVSCLPISRAGDETDDCFGGTDERREHRRIDSLYGIEYSFHCWNDTKYISIRSLCDKTPDCPFNDDERFCMDFVDIDANFGSGFLKPRKKAGEFLYNYGGHISRPRIVYFKLSNIPTYLLQITIQNDSAMSSPHTNTILMGQGPTNLITSEYQWWCNRGVRIHLRTNNNVSNLLCLCPPSYYGDRCQYQNQRVSLTAQIQVKSDWRTIFIFLITLIDNEGNIQSHDYIEYLPILDCKAKFNIYLLYSTRPKDSSKNYSVQIDAYYQLSLTYRGSWIYPLQFPFLPVHRLPVLLRMPTFNMEPVQNCQSACIHGQCFHYINNQNITFCLCHRGWSGVHCNRKYICYCAEDSICISDSICLCPPDRFGSRCYLWKSTCHSQSCMNGGQCVFQGIRRTNVYENESMCICSEEYEGDRCEYRRKQTRIDISFHPQVSIPSSLLVHFIAAQTSNEPNRTAIMRKIGFNQYSLTLFTTVSFNIAFAQVSKQYYLLILQEKKITLANVSTQINPFHRCRSLAELFNATFANQHLLKRIKYYHLPCQQQSELVCFYDDIHMCLCTLDRTSNCFEFDHNVTYDCQGFNYCENQGYCFQDDPTCPTPPKCACHQCSFGSRCQLSTKGSTLSLDIILGYHIDSKTTLNQQPVIVKVAIALTTFMFVAGTINGFLSFQTFRRQQIHNVGCGLYLFASSIISIIIILMFTLKFWLLLLSKVGSINNRLFLYIQCLSIDYILRSLISISDWLSACVAIERAINVIKGPSFNKTKSKQVAKWIIFIVILLISCSYVYDPIHRRIIVDEEEERIWCISQYSSAIQMFDWILNIIHFFIPFTINCLSAMIIIIMAARVRSNSQKAKPFKEHLREQFREHRHLLISPCILVILAIPRLIISFLAGCMESAREAGLYLIGYFISFIPSMTNFVIFVLPSDTYKKEFREAMKSFCKQ